MSNDIRTLLGILGFLNAIFYPLFTVRWDISHLKRIFSIRQENHINPFFPSISPFSCYKYKKDFLLLTSLVLAFMFLQRDQRVR